MVYHQIKLNFSIRGFWLQVIVLEIYYVVGREGYLPFVGSTTWRRIRNNNLFKQVALSTTQIA
jgi:hypothetical protein